MNTAIEVSAVPAVNAQRNAVAIPVTKAVVSHDTSTLGAIATKGFKVVKTAKTKKAVKVSAVVKAVKATKPTYSFLEQLVVERTLWEQNAYRTSNDQLYELLGKCYAHYQAMCVDTEAATAMREGLTEYIEQKGYLFAKSTHTLNKIVRCVFGVDRRRVSAYGIVLRTALANDVTVDGLADFIREKNGVEEIRLAKSPNAKTPAEKAVLAGSYIGLHDFGTVTSPELSKKLDGGKIGKKAVFIGVWQADGSVIIRAVVESDTALNAALASYYAATKAEIAAQVKATAEKAIADAKQQAINNAAATASVTA